MVKIPLFGNDNREELIDYIDFPCNKNSKEYYSLCAVSLIID